MSATKKIVDLGVGGSGCGFGEVRQSGNDVVLEYEYGAGQIGRAVFDDVVAFRFSAEYYSEVIPDGSYDCVVEVLESEWLEHLRRVLPKGIVLSGRRHFAVFASNIGELEAIAQSVRLEAPRTGVLSC